jgi:hypothetical protein
MAETLDSVLQAIPVDVIRMIYTLDTSKIPGVKNRFKAGKQSAEDFRNDPGKSRLFTVSLSLVDRPETIGSVELGRNLAYQILIWYGTKEAEMQAMLSDGDAIGRALDRRVGPAGVSYYLAGEPVIEPVDEGHQLYTLPFVARVSTV